MSIKYITIQDASEISTKSTQTIRRLIKINKIKCKKQRTPQGFNYLVDRESLMKCFELEDEEARRLKRIEEEMVEVFDLGVTPDFARSTKKTRKKSVMNERPIPMESEAVGGVYEMKEGITIEATVSPSEPSAPPPASNSSDVMKFTAVLSQMVKMHQEEKERLYVLIEQFQKRSLVLEERIKRLEAPKRMWWKLW